MWGVPGLVIPLAPLTCCHLTGSCSGWGDSHFTTFDGTSYSFSDNCTYVLVREIRSRYGNFSVLLDNAFCAASPAAARCPRALRVLYQSTEVVLTTTAGPRGQQESLVRAGAQRSCRLAQGKGQEARPSGHPPSDFPTRCSRFCSTRHG